MNFFSFQYDFKSAPKCKAGMCSSTDSDCTSFKYPTMVSRTLKLLCQGTNASVPGKEILISPKNIALPLMTLAVWLETLLPLSQIPDEIVDSLIMSQPGKNGLTGVLNKKLILIRNL